MEQLPINPIAIPIAAIAALLVGFIWYHPKVFGNAWMKVSGMTEEKIKGGNMAVIFGLAIVATFTLIGMLLAALVGVSGAQNFASNPFVNFSKFIGNVLDDSFGHVYFYTTVQCNSRI